MPRKWRDSFAAGRVKLCHFGPFWRQGGRGYFNRGTLSEGPSRASGRHERTYGSSSFWGVAREREEDHGVFSAARYRRTAEIKRPKLDGFTGFIDQWPLEDLSRNRKQRHTAKRVFERLRDEHGFKGGYTTVKNYVREHGRRSREMFVPLAHAAGHAQADFGEAMVVIGGVEQKAQFFALDLPHSDACFVRAYPAAVSEAWIDGHVHAFAFFGRVPQSVLYDSEEDQETIRGIVSLTNRCLVAKILPDDTRKRAKLFSGFLSHYFIHDRYGRPGKGNE